MEAGGSGPEPSMNALPKISQLSSRVWRILGCNPGPMTLQGSNVYLVGTGKERILVDSGEDGYPSYIEALTKFVKEKDLVIDKVILTHWHKDHVGGLQDLASHFAEIGPTDFPLVFKFERLDAPDVNVPSDYPLCRLHDNQVITTTGASLKMLYTPGHTTDHCSLYLQEEEAIFSGDCILGEGTAVFEDLLDYMNSLKLILNEKPKVIYPGHGPVVSNPESKIKHYIEHRKTREDQIVKALEASSHPLTCAMLVKKIYVDTPQALLAAAELNVNHHLQKLLKEHRVAQKDDAFMISKI